jgi:hypothetical protein
LVDVGKLILDSASVPIVERRDLSTTVISSEQRTFVDFFGRDGETKESTTRRAYSMPDGPNALEMWLKIASASSAHADPFLLLDEAQWRFLHRFTEFGALPAFIDGPGGSGKTTILVSLIRGVLHNRTSYPKEMSTRIITSSESLTNDLRDVLAGHLELIDGYSDIAARQRASDVCVTLDEYLISLLPGSLAEKFMVRENKVTWPIFFRWFNENVTDYQLQLTVHEAWAAIRIQITGNTDGREDPVVGAVSDE